MAEEHPTSLRTSWTTSLDSAEVLQRRVALQGEQLRLLGSAIHVAGLGIAILTPAVEAVGPRIAFVNDSFLELYGYERADVIGQTPVVFGIIEDHEPIFNSLLGHVFSQQAFDGEAMARRKDGAVFDADLHLVPVDDGGELTHWVAFIRDVTIEKSQVLQLRHQATHDGLTNLPNRTHLFDRLEQNIVAARQAGGMLALLVMDLDRFKEVNDTFGHHFGDMLLKQVAFRLRNQLREGDTVARLGGDEFAMVLDEVADANVAARIARNILHALEQPFVVEDQALEVGASIGIALFPSHGGDARTLLRLADTAMYNAKQGQTGYSFHREQVEARSPDQLAIVVEMRSALERNEFELYYQPKIHLRSGLMTRAEVLLRWMHPKRGMVVPAVFIPIAERTGIIHAMTDWLFERAMAQARAWQDAGAPVHLAVNISAKSLLDQSLPTKVQALLDRWQVDPRFLKIEITESSIMADPAHALAIMSMLQSMGVRLSIDDFGTGFSSLTHLRQLPIDEIKIDKSFVGGMRTSEADAAIVRAVIDLAHHLGKQVCAEGVEDEATLVMLRESGCDLAQGYWISRPVSAPDLMQWLIDTAWGLKFRPTA